MGVVAYETHREVEQYVDTCTKENIRAAKLPHKCNQWEVASDGWNERSQARCILQLRLKHSQSRILLSAGFPAHMCPCTRNLSATVPRECPAHPRAEGSWLRLPAPRDLLRCCWQLKDHPFIQCWCAASIAAHQPYGVCSPAVCTPVHPGTKQSFTNHTAPHHLEEKLSF